MIPLDKPDKDKELLDSCSANNVPISSKQVCSKCKGEFSELYKDGLCVLCYYAPKEDIEINKAIIRKIRRIVLKESDEPLFSKLDIREEAKTKIIEDFSNKEWVDKLEASKGFCLRCKKYIGIAHLTLDHIYPVSLAYQDFLKTGIKRVYTINDIQPLCSSCNSSKGAKIE